MEQQRATGRTGQVALDAEHRQDERASSLARLLRGGAGQGGDRPFLALAPLAGYTDLPFRLLCVEHGADLVFTEMISCHGLVQGQDKTWRMLATTAAERPVGVQLFGADPAVMAEAAVRVLDRYSYDLVDINMGCPVRKVCRRGAGAALMRDMALAERIIRAVVRAAGQVPVSVKFRAGPDAAHRNAVEFARMAEQAGAALLTVHGRTWAQGFSGTADREIIAAVKAAVDVPVLGNGDVDGVAGARAMQADTGCDGVMIGRAALGNPWVFAPSGRPDSVRERMGGLRRHLELLARHTHDPDRVLFRIRNHAGRYAAGLPGAAAFRARVHACGDFAALCGMVEQAMMAGRLPSSCPEGVQGVYETLP